MITAVDTNVILDVLVGDPSQGHASAAALRSSIGSGSLIACEVVWAELAAAFSVAQEMNRAMARLGIDYMPIAQAEATAAGSAWRNYRKKGGSRERLIGDFLVGAHALGQADRLLTRDRGFYRRCFNGLAVLDPSAPS